MGLGGCKVGEAQPDRDRSQAVQGVWSVGPVTCARGVWAAQNRTPLPCHRLIGLKGQSPAWTRGSEPVHTLPPHLCSSWGDGVTG